MWRIAGESLLCPLEAPPPRLAVIATRNPRQEASGRSKHSHDAGFVPSELNLRREMGAMEGGFWVLCDSISQNLSRQNQMTFKELGKS
jgi:hypothetical protein